MNKIIVLLSVFIFASCSLGKFKEQSVTQEKIATGYVLKKYGSLYYGGQPKSVDMIKLRQEGFVAIVNFRKHKEDAKYNEKWERNNSLLSGMSYYNMGFDPNNDELSNAYVNKLPGVIKEEMEKGKVLLHCKSGNRAAMWIAANAYLNQKANPKQTKDLAKKLGVKGKPLKLLNDYAK